MSAPQPSALRSARSLAKLVRKAAIAGMAALAVAMLFSSAAQAQLQSAAVVTDQSSLSVSGQFGVPANRALDAAADYAFIGDGDSAVFYRKAGGSTVRLLQAGDAVPGFAGSQVAQFGSGIQMNASGRILFLVAFSLADGLRHSAVMTYDGATSTYATVAFSDSAPPGTTTGTTYGQFTLVGINSNGDVAFTAQLIPLGPTGQRSATTTLYIAPGGGTPVRVVGLGDAVPGIANSGISNVGAAIAFNSNGQVLFPANIAVTGTAGTKSSLLVASIAGGAQKVVMQTDPAPNGGTFTAAITGTAASLNDNGQVVFFGTAATVVASGYWEWTASSGIVTSLPALLTSASVPASLPGGGTLSTSAATAPTIDDQGDVLFTAAITGNTNSPTITSALLRYHISGASAGTTDVVAYINEAASGVTGKMFSTIQASSMANDGTVGFQVTLSGGGHAVYEQSSTGTPGLVAADGAAAPVSGGGTFLLLTNTTVKSLGAGSVFFDADVSGGTAYYGEFTGTTSGVQSSLMSTADPLPGGARVVLPAYSAGTTVGANAIAFLAQRAGGLLSLFEVNLGGNGGNGTATTTPILLATEGTTPAGVGPITFSFSYTVGGAAIFVNENGQVLLPTSIPLGSAVFLASPAGVTKVVAVGDSSPIAGTTYTAVGWNTAGPSPLNDSGEVAFAAQLSNGQTDVFAYSPSGTVTIAAPGYSVTGLTVSNTFSALIDAFTSPNLAINSSGEVAIPAVLVTGGIRGFLLGSGNNSLQAVAVTGTAVMWNGTNVGTLNSVDDLSSFNSSGQIAFQGTLLEGTTTVNGDFVTSSGSTTTNVIQEVISDGATAPGTGGGTFSTDLTFVVSGQTFTTSSADVEMNDEGDVLIRSNITGGTTNSGLFRILAYGPQAGVVQPIVLQGQAAPSGLGTFGTIGGANTPGFTFALGDQGQVAVAGTVITSGGATQGGDFLVGADGTISKIVAAGDAMQWSGGGTFSLQAQSFSSLGGGAFVFQVGASGGNSNQAVLINLPVHVGNPSSTSVVSSLNPSSAGQSVLFTATVAGTAGLTPSNIVTLVDNGALIAVGQLDANGQVSFNISTLASGSHSIEAAYIGDTFYSASLSAPLSQTVTSAVSVKPTSISLGSSANPSTTGQSILFTATVSSTAGGTPTGNVDFLDGGNLIGTGALNGSGQATFSTSSLAFGPQSITAEYFGDANYGSSVTPSALNQTVELSSSNTIITVAGGAAGQNQGNGNQFNVCAQNKIIGGFGGYSYLNSCGEIFAVSLNGQVTPVVGTGVTGYSGDGGPATNAQIASGASGFLDSTGNLYIADAGNDRIRVVNMQSTPITVQGVTIAPGTIQTVAGNGTAGYNSDNIPATSAELNLPSSVVVNSAGNIFIADEDNYRIREVSAGVITTIAGTGTSGYAGDNGPATSAEINLVTSLALDSSGNIYLADSGNQRVRVINRQTSFIVIQTVGISAGGIATIAGNGTASYTTGTVAISSPLNNPVGVFVDTSNNVFISDENNERVREVSSGTISTVAGNGTAGYSSGLAATSAGLSNPTSLYVATSGDVFFSDLSGVHEVVVATGILETVLGNSAFGYSGDNGPATSAQMFSPQGVAVDGSGNIVIADAGNYRLRKVNGATGVITTIAGNGTASSSGDNGLATSATVLPSFALAIDHSGNIFFGERSYATGAPVTGRVREIVAATGDIMTVAGTGTNGVNGDGGPATSAQISQPTGIALDTAGNLYLTGGNANNTGARVRVVNRQATNLVINGITILPGDIQTVAGTGVPGYAGDGGSAISAQFNNIMGVAVDAHGNIYVADTTNARIRVINTQSTTITVAGVSIAPGTVQTVAGSGVSGFGGDGGSATAALITVDGLVLDGSGNIFFVDGRFHVREVVNSTGIIQTVAGFASGFSGDGGPATSAELNVPIELAIDASGHLYVSDEDNARIRMIGSPNPVPAVVSLSPSSATAGSASFTLTVNGADFVSGATVIFNGKTESTTFVNANQLTATVTASDIANDGTFQVMVTNPVPSAATSGSLPFTVVTLSPTSVLVTVGTNPSGLLFTVDGTTYSSPQTLTWTTGASHTIATTSPQTSAGTQSTFATWSDGGTISHSVTAPATATTYTANFNTSYQLTTAASPSIGGSVSPASGAYYAAGTVVNLSATPSASYNFISWTGPVANPGSAMTTVTMNGPQSVTANFDTTTGFEVPNSGTGALEGTIPVSINSSGTITGVYFNPAAVYHGFVCTAPCSSPTYFDGPNPAPTLNEGILPLSINSAGDIAGIYWGKAGTTNQPYSPLQGFVCTHPCTSSSVTFFNLPGNGPNGGVPTTIGNRGISGMTINDSGVVVGNWSDQYAIFHGFVCGSSIVPCASSNATTTSFDNPNAGTNQHSDQGTFPISINASGTVTGYYVDGGGLRHGFVCAAPCTSGTSPTTLDVPGASLGKSLFGGGTLPVSINASGVIAGSYADANGVLHAFMWTVPYSMAQLTIFDAPGAYTSGTTSGALVSGTVGVSVNTAGDITGFYEDANGVFHGFVRAVNGMVTSFDAPGAFGGGISHLVQGGTYAASINSAGAIVGFYPDANMMFHGFMRAPGTTTTLASSANPSVYGQPVTFTAQVTSGDVTPPNGETVSFMQGTTLLGTGTLSGGTASLMTSALPLGTSSITAVYAGDTNFVSSTSSPVSQVVNMAATTVAVVPSPNPSTAGQPLTLTAMVSVTAPGAGTPTGTVTFFDGPTSLGTGTLTSNDLAVLVTSSLAAGTHSITATYGGDANFSPSGSTAASQVILPAPPPTIAMLSPASAVAGGAGFTLTVSGTGFVGGATVNFNGAAKATTFVSSSGLTATITSADIVAAGSVNVTVTNPAPATGTSAPQSFTINNPLPTTTSISPTSAVAGGPAFTLTVNGTNFNSSSVVTFNGTARSTTFVSATQVTMQVTTADLATAGTLNLTVSNPAPGGGTSGPQTFTVNNPVPAITSLSPLTATAGGAGFTLTVNGTNFVPGTSVSFNGAAKTTAYVSATQVTALITAADIATAGTFNVTAANAAPGGGTSANSPFTVNNPVPTITTLSPTGAFVGGSGFTLTVNGTNFNNSSVVTFNGTARTTTFVSATQVTISVTSTDIATVGTLPVSVTNPTPGGGTSGTINFLVTNPVPAISTLSPTSATAGAAGFTLTVNGSLFVNGATVSFNGTPQTTTFVNATQVTASITAAEIATAGTFNVSVTNPSPGGGTSGNSSFTVNNPVPTTTSLSPTNTVAGGPAFTLTVNGTNFNSSSVVTFNGTARTTTFVSATELTIQVTTADIATAGTLTLTVANPAPGGGSSGAQTFTVNNPVPTVTTLSPASATLGGAGFTLTVNGTNFNSSSVVTFNGTVRTTTFVSATQLTIQITTADLAASGTLNVTVTNPAPGGGTSGISTFAVNNPLPSITSLSPSSAIAGGGAFTLTVDGANFVSGAMVNFNGAAVATMFASATQLTASIPAAATTATGTFNVTVTNPAPGGGVSGTSPFAVNNPVPAIASLSPNNAIVGGAPFTMTVTGSNFVSGATVSFNGSNKTTTFVSATQVTAQITTVDLAAAGAVNVIVTNPTPGGGASSASTFTVNNPAPAISLLSPNGVTAGGSGFTLMVTGTGFVSSSVVNFNGTPRATTFVSSTQLNATILQADISTVGSANVTVTNPAPGGGTTTNFTFNISSAPNPVPTLASISPTSGVAGQAVNLTLTGTNFIAGSIVNFGGNGDTGGTASNGGAALTITIPASQLTVGGPVSVTVTNPAPGGGTSAAQTFTVNNPVPVVSTLSPASAVVGGAAFTLTVNGSNFVPTSMVNFNATARTTTFVNTTQLTIQVTVADLATSGSLPVTVTNPAPGGGTSGTVNFAVTNPLPTITTLAPNSATAGAEGFTLTVTGTGFVNGATVNFNGTAAATTFVSSTQLTASITAPEVTTAGTLGVTVTNPAPGGGTSPSSPFTVNNPVPAVTTLSPTTELAGGPAFTLTVNGTNFNSSSVVNLNGVAETTSLVNSTQVTASIPATAILAAGTFNVTVSNPSPGGGVSGTVPFSVNNPVPTVASLSPTSAVAGGPAFTLMVTGTNFVGTSAVTFNGTPRTTTFVSGTQLTIQVAATDIAAAGTFNVSVTNPNPGGGTSGNSTFTVTNPVPTIASLSPANATSGGPAFSLTVNGTNFVSTSVVNFNGSAKSTTFVSATQLTASVTAADIAAAGTFNVTVTNLAPGGGTSGNSQFTVNNPVPTITSLSPSSAIVGGASFTLTVNGTGFLSGATVSFNGNSLAATFVSATQITATIPAALITNTGTISVTATNPAPTTGPSAAQPFAVNNPVPTITTISPTSGTAGGAAFALTVNGTNFNSSSVVNFNGTATATTFMSATQISAAIAAAQIAAAGTFNVTVSNPTPGGGTSGISTFTVNNPVPTITTLSPTSATKGAAAFTLTVNGTNFNSSSLVNFNGTVAITTLVSATQVTAAITAADIAAAGTFNLTVTNPTPGGGTSGTLPFGVTDFAVGQVTSGTVAVTPGTPATVTLSVMTTPANQPLPATMTFTCAVASGLTGAGCSLNPATIAAGTVNGSTVLTITTTSSLPPTSPRRDPSAPYFPWVAITGLVGLMALWLAGQQRFLHLRARPAYLTLALLLIAGAGLLGCTTSSSLATPTGPSTVTVTATSGGVSKPITVNINVQ